MVSETSSSVGAFIVIEGLDGAGTTTQCRLLVDWLNDRGHSATGTREPSDGPVGSLIRQMLSMRVVAPDDDGDHKPVREDVLALLFAADRLDHVDTDIEPALGEGRMVVSDRYYHSSLAYQADGELDDESFDTSWVRRLNERAVEPDVTFFLEASPDICLERLRERDRRDIYENSDKLESLARRYEAVVDEVADDGESVVRVNAERSIETVHEAIVSEIEHRFQL